MNRLEIMAVLANLPDNTESTPEKPFSLFNNGVDIWICHHDSPDGQVAVYYRPQDPDDYYNTDQASATSLHTN